MLAAFPQETSWAAENTTPATSTASSSTWPAPSTALRHRRIQGADPAVQQARLALCIGAANAIFNALTMFKINVPEQKISRFSVPYKK